MLRSLIFVLLLSLVSSCNFFDVICKAKKAADSVEDHLEGNAKSAFEECMNNLINNQLPAIERQLQALSHGILTEAEDDLQNIVSQVTSTITNAINDAAAAAIKVEDHARNDIITVINTAFTQLNSLEERVVEDANNLLDKVDTLLDKASCIIEGETGNILAAVRAVADDGLIPNPFEFCRKQLNLGFTRVASLDNYSLYKFYKCKVLQKINEQTPITDVLGYLGEGQRTAAQFRCMSRLSPADSLVYTKEFINWGENYNAWNPPANGLTMETVIMTGDSKSGATKVTSFRPLSNQFSFLSLQLSRPPAFVASASANPPTCANMVDCYSQAMLALQQAETLVTNFSGDLSKVQSVANDAMTAATKAQSIADSAVNELKQVAHINKQICRDVYTDWVKLPKAGYINMDWFPMDCGSGSGEFLNFFKLEWNGSFRYHGRCCKFQN